MTDVETSPGLEKANLAPYQTRVVEEGRELATRISALEAYLSKGAPGASPAEHAVMYTQLAAMKTYSGALFQRSVLWVREGKLRNPSEAS